MWVTRMSSWGASEVHSRAALGRGCSLLCKDQAQSLHYWSITLKKPWEQNWPELQWIHWIQIHSPISFNKTWINPTLENRIYNVTRFLAWIFDDCVPGDIICDVYLEPNTGNESNWSSIQPQVQGHTLFFKHHSNLGQKRACADCLEVGIQVLKSFSEVTTPIVCITESLLSRNTGVATGGGWWDPLMTYFCSGSVRNWGRKKLRK